MKKKIKYDDLKKAPSKISALYKKVKEGKSSKKDIAELAKLIILYEEFHVKIYEFKPRRSTDFYHTIQKIAQEITLLGKAKFDSWLNVWINCVFEFEDDLENEAPSPWNFLSDLTTNFVEISSHDHLSVQTFERLPKIR